MKIHLIKKQTIKNFVSGNMGSGRAFNHWLTIIKFADWSKPADILRTFSTADLLGKNSGRVVFDIGGNKYRMICKYFNIKP